MKVRLIVVSILLVAIAVVAAGCGGSNNSTAETTAPATTATTETTAGTTTETTASTTAETTASTTTETTASTATGAAAGDATAGKTFFQGTCQTCHLNGGTAAGVGPVLANKGLTADAITNQIQNPVGAMPKGLASGQDLANVVAFVVGLQGAASGGATTTAATTTAATTTAATTTTATTTGGGGNAAAIAAGKTFFEGTCQGCHSKGGTAAGVGPKLAGAGLTADKIKTQVKNGGSIMPAGLASGTDLENVVAYLLSLQ